ncbi:nucleophile aminohydrolase [Gorgonomyces haynaldii]|nr:nucleophile aminohydrolase [Gorgonomyces haynaldii]
MFRNQYDGDNTTWSPQGRIHQVEYAMEAVKQGSAIVGLVSKKHAVLVSLKRSPGELASYQKKIIKIDSHLGVGFSGLTSDARVLSHFMISECMKSRMVFDRPLPVSRVVTKVAYKAQINTQRYGRRPYGVGLLVIGHDTAPRLYECAPDGNAYAYRAIAIGSRSQSAKTGLEKNVDQFENATVEQLVVFGLRALRDTLQQDKQLTLDNCAIAIVGEDTPFKIYEGQEVVRFLDLLTVEQPQAMETDQ